VIEKYIYNEKTEGYVFWSYGNSPTQKIENITLNKIDKKFKALYLLSNKIIGSSSFYFESDLTRNITKKYLKIFKNGEALYFTDDAIGDFLEHGIKKIEKSPPALTAYNDKVTVNRYGNELNDLGFILKRRSESISARMRYLWSQDIYGSSKENEIARYLKANIKEDAVYQEYCAKLSNIASGGKTNIDFVWEYVSAKIEEFKLDSLIKGISVFLKKRLQELYLIATADILEINIDSSLQSYLSHYDSNLFLGCMRHLNLESELNRLTVSDLVKIKQCDEFLFFRDHYFKIIDAINNNYSIFVDAFDDLPSAIENRNKKEELVNSFFDEKKKDKYYRNAIDNLIELYDEIVNRAIQKKSSDLLDYYREKKDTGQNYKEMLSHKNSSNDQSVDVLVLVAMEEELDAFLNHIKKTKKIGIGNIFGYMCSIDGIKGNIVVVEVGKGNYSSTSQSRMLIVKLHPQYIILTGIIAGINDKCKLGDILVSEQIVAYEPGKISLDGLKRRPDSIKVNFDIIQKVKNARDTDWFSSILEDRPGNNQGKSNVYLGEILSGEKVVNNPDFKQELKTIFNQAIGVEMEGYGTALSAYFADANIKFVLIKGVCDYADKKNDEWHKYAADAASAFTVKLIEKILDTGR
jgi:nucleoside phosphorylase